MKKKLSCILLIDDDEPTNILNSEFIEETACTEHIEVMQSGQAALNFFKNRERFTDENCKCRRPDLVLLDINMPAMNGWEFLVQYNELDKELRGKIVIVMLTTSLNPDDKIKAMAMPAIAGFETKPITPEKLNKLLRTHFADNFDQ